MAPYYKYEVIYTREPNGNEKVILVCLGLLKSGRRPIVTPNTYAFRIFSSQLEIKDLKVFLEDEYEFKNSVMHFIGELYTFSEYSEHYEDLMKLNAIYEKNQSVVVARTVANEQDKKAYIVRNNTRFRVLPYHAIQFEYAHVATNRLRIDYQVAEV